MDYSSEDLFVRSWIIRVWFDYLDLVDSSALPSSILSFLNISISLFFYLMAAERWSFYLDSSIFSDSNF